MKRDMLVGSVGGNFRFEAVLRMITRMEILCIWLSFILKGRYLTGGDLLDSCQRFDPMSFLDG